MAIVPRSTRKRKPVSKKFIWRMPDLCVDCLFAKSGPGKQLADSLPDRLKMIKSGLRIGQYFICHKTTKETGDGSRLICAGALAYQQQRGVTSDYQILCEQLDGCKESKGELFKRLRGVVAKKKEKRA